MSRGDNPQSVIRGQAVWRGGLHEPHRFAAAEDRRIHATEDEKQSPLQRLTAFHGRHAAQSWPAREQLKRAMIDNKNIFAVLVDAVRCRSLGQFTNALFGVGGQYRRNM